MQIKWKLKKWKELSHKEIYEIFKLRSKVFVVEQECVYLDLDGKDEEAKHVLGKNKKQVVAYARIIKKKEKVYIGRIVVERENRGKKIGEKLVKKSIKYIEETNNEKEIMISAQEHLDYFYTKLGFKKTGKKYLEDGIPHQEMKY
tara:strand:- start:2966 stop:3400 length:435 start_codon:yes stop_codon:yes gene_type:complete